MSDQRHDDSSSILLTEEDLGVEEASDATLQEGVTVLAADAQVPDSAPLPGGAEKPRKPRRTVRIPDDTVARPSKPPPPPAPVAQPIVGQRIIAVGEPPKPPPPRAPTMPPPVPPRPRSASVPSIPPPAEKVDAAASQRGDAAPPPRSVIPSTEREPQTDPRVEDSWTPYQPVAEPIAAAQPLDKAVLRPSAPPPAEVVEPASPPKPLTSPLVAAPARELPPSQRRPSVQFESPPVWARPPVRPDVEIHPPEARPRAPSTADATRASNPGIDVAPRVDATSAHGEEYRPRAPSTVGATAPSEGAAFRRSSPSHSELFHTPEPPRSSSPEIVRRPAPAPGSSPQLDGAPRVEAITAPRVEAIAAPRIEVATSPGSPWGPPRESMVDVAVDFESDVTLLEVDLAPPSTPDIHARATRLDAVELSSDAASLPDESIEIEAAPPSVDEVEIEPDSDSRERLEAAPEIAAPKAPPPPPVKAGPPAPKPATPSGLGNLAPAPLTDASAQRKKARPWWEDLFNDDFVRTHRKTTDAEYKAEVDFIEDSLAMEKGATLLDLACGTGKHAIELSKRGYRMVGFDLSLAMLARAADLAQAEDQRINFVQGDMREMQFEEAFDGAYCWNTSFGYFEEEKNAHVLGLVHRALRKGGQLLLDVINRDYIIQQSPTTAWFEGDGCICMDEMYIDWITSRMRCKRTIMFDDGRSRELEYSIRLYSLHELGRLLHEQGFRVAQVSGLLNTPGVYFGCQSPRLMILAEKR